jgi:hypothetical protein
MSDGQDHQEDRRAQPGLRAIFEEAYVLVSPFLDTANSWGNKPLIWFAQIALREKYPNMTPQDASILLSAVRRVYAERQLASG